MSSTRQDVQRLYDLQRHLYTIHSQLESLEREKRIKELTLQQLETLSSDSVVYKSIGRMFALESYQNVVNSIHEELHTVGEQLKNKQTLQSQFEAKLESTRQEYEKLSNS